MNLEICSSKIDVNILYRIAHGALLKKAIVPHSFDPTKVLDRFKKEYPLRSIPDFTATSALHEYPSGLI